MSFAVIGISHHDSPVEIRERFVFTQRGGDATLDRLCSRDDVSEAVLLSTCNRTEFYLFQSDVPAPEAGGAVMGGTGRAASEELPATAVERCAVAGAVGGAGLADAGLAAAMGELARHAGLTLAEAGQYLYAHTGRQAVAHLFRVASSLDSMVLGEAQIQGQVRSVCEEALATHAGDRRIGPMLTRLFQSAVVAGKRVRTETVLGQGAASVPAAAMELARRVLGPLAGRHALVLGTGEMSQLAMECLASERVGRLIIASRSAGRVHEVAGGLKGEVVRFDELPVVLPQVEIVVSATASPHAVLTRDLVERALPGGPARPLFIIDVALPRDVEPAVGRVENVFLHDIDDLRQIVDANLERRRAEIPRAERILEDAVDVFWAWSKSLAVVPLIRAFRRQAESLRRAEMAKLRRRLGHLSPEDRQVVDAMTKQLLNKLLHGPTSRLRDAASNGSAQGLLAAARYLLLEEERERRRRTESE